MTPAQRSGRTNRRWASREAAKGRRAEHWIHLRSTNTIESTFATVRLRTKKTKGAGSRAAGPGHDLKAARGCRATLALRQCAGATFVDGVKLEREDSRRRRVIRSPQSTTIDNFPASAAATTWSSSGSRDTRGTDDGWTTSASSSRALVISMAAAVSVNRVRTSRNSSISTGLLTNSNCP